jgi:hypothetical protein
MKGWQTNPSQENAMQEFIKRHQKKITGVLSCFDRVVIHGHLPFNYPDRMWMFLNQKGVLGKKFTDFVTEQSSRLKEHAKRMAERAGRPYEHLLKKVEKDKLARMIAERDGITQGLICVLTAVEKGHTFAWRYNKPRPKLITDRRPCLFVYYYFMDRDFGLMHVRIQTWFPMQIQVYVNGHEWLARKLDRNGIAYHKIDNAFTWIADCERAQRFADRFVNLNWVRLLNALAKRVNPLIQDLLVGWSYYWVADEAEFATDVMFKNPASLESLYPKLLRHSTLCFGAEDVMTFLGKKLHGCFLGEVINDCKRRKPGARVKHWVSVNCIKMYDKHRCVLRIETVINYPYQFKIWRKGERKGKEVMGWFSLTKCISYLYRYAQICHQANARYLQALSAVEDPTESYQLLDSLCSSRRVNDRSMRGFNPLARTDVTLFAAVMRGEHALHGFRNAHLQAVLFPQPTTDPVEKRRRSAKVTRLLQRLHAFHRHGTPGFHLHSLPFLPFLPPSPSLPFTPHHLL